MHPLKAFQGKLFIYILVVYDSHGDLLVLWVFQVEEGNIIE